MRILVIEDDENLRIALDAALRGAGYAVDTASDLPEADEALSVNDYDGAVFDRMLPGGDTLTYVTERRRTGWPVPVLFLTARDTVGDRTDGLRVGDDYLVKPFAMAELLVRVGALCRRGGTTVTLPVLRHADLELDVGRHEARRAGTLLSLTAKEFQVLHLLMAAAGEPVTHRDLIAEAWDEYVHPSSNVLAVLIANLRSKLGPDKILHTVRGTGYMIR